MAVTYCTAVQVANRMALTKADGLAITAATIADLVNPTQAVIEERINEAEQQIDSKCHRSWRSTAVSDYEYHDFTYRDYVKSRRMRWGRVQHIIMLKYQRVSAIDELGLLTANDTWTDLVATGSAGSTPYDTTGDYYLQGDDGKIYLLDQLPIKGWDNIRVKYTYGANESVPNDIRNACIMLTASMLIDILPDTAVKAEGEFGAKYGELKKEWLDHVDRILEQYNLQSFRPVYI